ncbi:MAG: hypothetical protein LHW64_00340 [Candidatus Cloacimonetes bacterium]|jgi:hypothetical protein|nr:hypothetical protein [Candidatus Cloacimonadota bacterium]MCB5286236.1 hypothetical protein [Candidatus Cloacimonadota bacterium]MCK9184224.1 hypothetical protein [Candidatus Cloacimonadota bacterium]MCK9584054.1 hypothetical protein [Candidatus Cloacimonadota bacterium]MDY0228558.1 hypothetical protein [Candidatus Cloacimonadaceae bacterium]
MKICELNTDIVTKLVEDELSYHPHLEPVDLYKLLYQALYGPFHIAGDYEQVFRSIQTEVELSSSLYEPLFQELGPCYSRVSLAFIQSENEPSLRQRKIAFLTDWLLESSLDLPDVKSDFQRQWELYRHLLKTAVLASPVSWQEADDLVKAGHLPSHSQTFHQHYQPHYRLVNINYNKQYQLFMEFN